jgi:hypothetical protein
LTTAVSPAFGDVGSDEMLAERVPGPALQSTGIETPMDVDVGLTRIVAVTPAAMDDESTAEPHADAGRVENFAPSWLLAGRLTVSWSASPLASATYTAFAFADAATPAQRAGAGMGSTTPYPMSGAVAVGAVAVIVAVAVAVAVVVVVAVVVPVAVDAGITTVCVPGSDRAQSVPAAAVIAVAVASIRCMCESVRPRTFVPD